MKSPWRFCFADVCADGRAPVWVAIVSGVGGVLVMGVIMSVVVFCVIRWVTRRSREMWKIKVYSMIWPLFLKI